MNSVSLTINSGEIMGFAGLKGAGKSTAIRLSTGIIYPTSGTVIIDGHDIVCEKVKASANVGWVPWLPDFETNPKPLTCRADCIAHPQGAADDACFQKTR